MPKHDGIAVDERHLQTLRNIVSEHLPGIRVLVFGSRVTGKGLKCHSDIDLLIDSKNPLSLRQRRRLIDALEDSSLPVHVDVVERADADEGFFEAVRRDAVPL